MPNNPQPEPVVFRAEREKPPVRTPEQQIAEVLDQEDRVIAGRLVQSFGLSKDQVHRRVKRGSMHRKQRGVYTAGNADVGERGEWRAAVLAVGDDAFLDAGSACALWGARDTEPGELIHVVCRREVDHREGVRVHMEPGLAVRDTTLRDGIRVVMPARALLGFAATNPERKLRRAVNQMLVERRVSVPQIIDLIARSRGRRGVARLARALADAKPTRSELEDMAVAAFRGYGADFDTNRKVAGREVDILFPEAGVVVEVDSRFHDTPLARADDEAKDAALVAAGLVVVRIRLRDLTVHLHRRVPAILALVDARTGAFSRRARKSTGSACAAAPYAGAGAKP